MKIIINKTDLTNWLHQSVPPTFNTSPINHSSMSIHFYHQVSIDGPTGNSFIKCSHCWFNATVSFKRREHCCFHSSWEPFNAMCVEKKQFKHIIHLNPRLSCLYFITYFPIPTAHDKQQPCSSPYLITKHIYFSISFLFLISFSLAHISHHFM